MIVQPVVENERWADGSPDLATMRQVTAMARAALPEEVSVQVPPNLTPATELIDCGVDDLGGVSPVTDDHINPDYTWPALRELEEIAASAALPLEERLPVYERFLPPVLRTGGFDGRVADGAGSGGSDGSRDWISSTIRNALAADDSAGERYRAVLRDGTATVTH